MHSNKLTGVCRIYQLKGKVIGRTYDLVINALEYLDLKMKSAIN